MSGKVEGDTSCPTYAVVNISQKRKNISRNEGYSSSPIELYSVVNKQKSSRKSSQKIEHEDKSDVGYSHSASKEEKCVQSVYSAVGRENNSPEYSAKFSTGTLTKGKFQMIKSAGCKSLCIVITSVIISLAVIALAISIAISFVIISRLRSDIVILQNQTEVMSLLLKQAENTILRKTTVFGSKLNEINISFLNDMNEIKSLINTSKQHLLHRILELNASVTVNHASLHDNISLIVNATFGYSMLAPAPSCQVIHFFQPSATSGYYWVRSSNGSSVQVYCEMTMKCNGTRGLQRVALINNETRSEVCVDELTTSSNSCISRSMTSGCSSIIFPVHNVSYSHVCGSLEGYGTNSPDGYNRNEYTRGQKDYHRPENATINDNYVDGISLTYGEMNNRNHIWTFVGGPEQECLNSKPGFIHNSRFSCLPLLGSCQPSNMCLAMSFQVLLQATSENIEMRLCRDQESNDEDILLRNAEIYVW